jgi:hypothetical protein
MLIYRPPQTSRATPVPSEPGLPVFAGRVAVLREEVARLVRARPVPAQAPLEVLRLLHQAEQLSACRDRLLLDTTPDGPLRTTLAEREMLSCRHVEALAGRIVALGGSTLDAPSPLPAEAAGTLSMVVCSLLAMRGTIKLYRAAIRFLAPRDRETAIMLHQLLAEAEAQLTSLRMLLP